MKLSIIGLKTRQHRRKHIISEFKNKELFEVSIKDAVFHKKPNVSLWLSICEVIRENQKEDFFIICEDDHKFTNFYSEENLLKNIELAKEKKADLLLGGVSWFNEVLSVDKGLCELDFYNGNQFCVLFNQSFDKILNNKIKEDTLIVDMELSLILQKKYVITPFISIQKSFFQSDMRPNLKQDVESFFINTEKELNTIKNNKFHS